MSVFTWGDFEQVIDAGIFSGNNVCPGPDGGPEFMTKKLQEEGAGRLEYLHAPDFRVIVADFSLHTRKQYQIADTGLVRFHFGCDVSIETTVAGSVFLDLDESPAGILVAHPDQVMVEQIPAETQQRFVTVACQPQWIESVFGVRLSDHVSSDMAETPHAHHHSLPYAPALRQAARGIIDGALAGRLRPAFVAAKGQELVALALDHLLKTGSKPKHRLTERDVAAVEAAREILEQSYASPLDIALLSRRVGINRTKLFYGFTQIHGMSAAQFVDRHRMDQARHLLVETDMAISDIALAVGYEHACNFSTRFKAYFQCSPRDMRRTRVVPRGVV